MGSWSLAHLQGSGENRSEGPSKRAHEDSDTSWVPALWGSSPFQAASGAGHVVHTTDFILSCHLRLKTYLCSGWCAWELCSELLASVLKRKRKKKFYLQDSVDGIHLQNTELERRERKRTALMISGRPLSGENMLLGDIYLVGKLGSMQNWPSIWGAAGGINAGLDDGEDPCIPDPREQVSHIFTAAWSPCDGVVRGGEHWQGRGISSVHLSVLAPPEHCTPLRPPPYMGSGTTVGIGWKNQASFLSPWASSGQTSVGTAGEHFSGDVVTPLKKLIALFPGGGCLTQGSLASRFQHEPCLLLRSLLISTVRWEDEREAHGEKQLLVGQEGG